MWRRIVNGPAWPWVIAILGTAVMCGSCNYTFTVEDYPYCPTSDSARANADSIPLGCEFPELPDTSGILP